MVSLRRKIYEPEHPVIPARRMEMNWMTISQNRSRLFRLSGSVLVFAQENKENSFEIAYTANNVPQKKLFAKRSRDNLFDISGMS